MADVTDCVFRRVVAEIAKPDVFFTEFTSADGLAHEKGREKLLINLKYSELERPIVAQIFGSHPENINKAAILCKNLGFDGIDINMGCPDKKVEKQGAGAALIKNPKLALGLIDAALDGAGGLPVSIKTRLGYNEIDYNWLETLISSPISALTVHLRTRKEMSKVPAHWEFLGYPNSTWRSGNQVKFIANGDVEDLGDAREKANENNLDGVMLGRAIFGNPWLYTGKPKPDWPEVFRVMIHHCQLFEEMFAPRSLGGVGKNFALMRKFFGAYVSGHPHAHELKVALMLTNSASDVVRVVKNFSEE
ncbi:MAG: tRNA-dihydrouridine synthase [Patescibacteria group bacterium]